jgi:predicted O-methyltransferase YrrM
MCVTTYSTQSLSMVMSEMKAYLEQRFARVAKLNIDVRCVQQITFLTMLARLNRVENYLDTVK